MLFENSNTANSPSRTMIRDFYRKNENKVLETILPIAETSVSVRNNAWQMARGLILEIRRSQSGRGGVDALLQEFAISSEEGVVLMCLAEALLRVPDSLTADQLIRDKLGDGDWVSHIGQSDSMFVNASSWGLLLTGKLVNYRKDGQKDQYGVLKQLLGRLGEPVIRRAVKQSMELMGSQFVMGVTIEKALKRAKTQEAKGYTYSYDMLGEGARSMQDADRYFQSYMGAIQSIGKKAKGKGPINSAGISIKLSAIHPRYEMTHAERVMSELVPRLKTLAMEAKKYDIGLTVDAEEADRLELSLEVIQAVFSDADLGDWQGFGMAVQAYQKRAIHVIDWIDRLTQKTGRKMMVRLVKGAYWDSEIKISQAEGFKDYPVFTRKASTDVSYQACAKRLLDCRELIYPQFASHNAYTVATILQINMQTEAYQQAGQRHQGFEFQRLHGMGESLFDQIVNHEKVACRIYAPVGAHVDLLAYLVRRLLENGANSSFVNNIVDETISVESLLDDPFEKVMQWQDKRHSLIPQPKNLYGKLNGKLRVNSKGLDISDHKAISGLKKSMDAWFESNQKSLNTLTKKDPSRWLAVTNPANHQQKLAYLKKDDDVSLLKKLSQAEKAHKAWQKISAKQRAAILNKTADALEKNRNELMALCIKEAGKTTQDAIAEVREAVDFCRYYAIQAETSLNPLEQQSLGVVLCISPWNFPLAIFLGQVSAALAAGNCVVAKPAEQTSFIAHRAVEILYQSGLPKAVVSLLQARGSQVGKVMVADPRVKAVMFTGSTQVGSWMARALAERAAGTIPLVAETGGQNCMIVDSTALPEQVVDDVVASAFQSAGQRCSALRVLFVQDNIADKVIDMTIGAMRELKVGDPAWLSTDVGPVIDQKALGSLQKHAKRMTELEANGLVRLRYCCELDQQVKESATFFAPRLYEIDNLSLLKEEVFGPCVHVIRYAAKDIMQVMQQIKDTGFGLTMGIHSRIGEKSQYLAEHSVAGNVYINRNMIGAIVGVQPFGGRGLSGTGPKAGGPHYLQRLVKWKGSLSPQPLSKKDMSDKRKQAGIETSKGQLKESHLIQSLVQGFNKWRYQPLSHRVSVVRQMLAHLGTDKDLALVLDESIAKARIQLSKIEHQLALPLELPGPTGESNCLYFEPRGVLLCLFDDKLNANQWLLLVITALAAGNAVLIIASDEQQQNSRTFAKQLGIALKHTGIYDRVLKIAPLSQLDVLLDNEKIAATLVNCESDWQAYLAKKLAQREGEILPVIAEYDLSQLYYRLVTEKTVSIDTTAAGGNTSLMTMNEDLQLIS
ncbi:MAG: bifunctional proline dehydrogenase/L-glutamate gamma-semialdehyde dehydrogenase PutA [Enterobacterales bacterium]|nr:bifunctional proline dehydrogenase/L-glutamate gamma-semialdehyde dehydrogenase PutA [Enterobacterales bacterium]